MSPPALFSNSRTASRGFAAAAPARADVYFYRKNGDYYMEQPYVGVWEISEELYNTLNEYVGEPAEPSKTIEGDTEGD